MAQTQEIRFATTADGVTLAYAVSGSGPPLVKAANWLSHLEFDWDSPVWRPYLDTFSSNFTYVRYDARGTGLSDADISELAFDDLVADLEAVVDAAGVDRFPLLGISQGGAVAISYAVRHPGRVSHLILLGAYGQGALKRGDLRSLEEYDLYNSLVRHGWGSDDPTFRHVFTSQLIPDGTARQHAWFDELMRRSASGENALAIFRTLAGVDVLDAAAEVAVPTLVFHSVGDRRVPFSEGRRLASLIPGARLVQLDTKNHLPLGDEPAWGRFFTELLKFVGVEGSTAASDRRSSSALLMTDIVDSTRLLSAMGDEAWSRLLEWHDHLLEDLFVDSDGKLLNHTGDGFLVAFDDEVAAVGCAVEIQRRLEAHRKQAGFAPQVRIGINAGEITWHQEGVGGIEVHKAARVASAAGAAEILVSRGVADRTEGEFSYGEVRLIQAKGIDEGLEVRAVDWE